jgi:hypothetical protein
VQKNKYKNKNNENQKGGESTKKNIKITKGKSSFLLSVKNSKLHNIISRKILKFARGE